MKPKIETNRMLDLFIVFDVVLLFHYCVNTENYTS